jgi:outer membrane receptor protein involved in Fe transport
MMKRSTLASAIYAALAFTAFSTVAFAQDSATAAQDEDKKDTTEIDEVVVTGSLIPQAMKDPASPVTTITAEDIQRQGYKDVADVLRSQPLSTGSVQDNQFTNGFTPGAETISLLGLSPGFTLILVDGRPLADYPLLYNGQSNITDLSSIPTAMVERIDILPGNQSAIYGSSAIAGVVNIILKKHIEGMTVGVRVGGFTQGGGDNYRLQLSGGQDWGRANLTYGLQHTQQDAIYGYERDFRDSTEDNPACLRVDEHGPDGTGLPDGLPDVGARCATDANGDPIKLNQFGSRTWLIFNPFSNQYVNPDLSNGVLGDGISYCDNIADAFGGTEMLDFRPGRGYYCGSRAEPGYSSLQNKERQTAIYLNGSWDLSENASLYGNLLFGRGKVTSDSGTRFWTPDINGLGFLIQPVAGYPTNPDGTCVDLDPSIPGNCDFVRFRSYQRIFSPEESGPNGSREQNTNDSYSLSFGVKGNLGASDWSYDAYYARSQYKVKNRQMWPLADEIEAFMHDQFIGSAVGSYYGYPVYQPNVANFYQMLTPEEYASFLGEIHTDSKAWTHSATFQVANTNLWEMGGGPVGMAALVTIGRQEWENPTDPRVIAGEFWGLTGTSGAGERSNWAAATEFRMPVSDKFTINLSGRFDEYSNSDTVSTACGLDGTGNPLSCGSDDSKFTWKVGFEVRPVETLLLRANYATAFRAPDMGYSFAGDSGFFTSATDYYGCYLDGVAIENCLPDTQIEGRRQGNPNLQSIEADSYGVGFVWSPTKAFDIRADYYNVDIENEVSDLSINGLLFDEYRCRVGIDGLTPTDPICVDAFARIERGTPFDPDAIDIVHINPINVSKERVSGIQMAANYRWDLGRAGNLKFGVGYNNTLTHEYQQFAGDDVIDLLHSATASSEFKTIATGDVQWEIGNFTAAVHGVRFGSTPNNAAQLGAGNVNGSPADDEGVAPYMLYNVNLAYDIMPNQTLSLTVNNAFDKDPPRDRSYGGVGDYPYYNIFNYSGVGRSWWLEYEITFGNEE